jgi:hypothetical protein
MTFNVLIRQRVNHNPTFAKNGQEARTYTLLRNSPQQVPNWFRQAGHVTDAEVQVQALSPPPSHLATDKPRTSRTRLPGPAGR